MESYLRISRTLFQPVCTNFRTDCSFLANMILLRATDSFLTTITADGEYCVLSSFESEPEKLEQGITSNELYFSANDRLIAKLYAPKEFIMGSSVYHLDTNIYKNTPDAVMTHADMPGESHNTIGPALIKICAIPRDPNAIPPKKCKNDAKPVQNIETNRRRKVIIIACAAVGFIVILVVFILDAIFRSGNQSTSSNK